MKKFTISYDPCSTGFQEHVTLDLRKPVADQLRRRRIELRKSGSQGNPSALKNIIDRNSSLRIEFGWSFESANHYEIIMDECLDAIVPKYHVGTNLMVSDMRCSWLGFMPFNVFEKESYEKLEPVEMILFNNELINFQADVVNFISSHKIFRQHAILRDNLYRYETFKSVNKDRDALAELYTLFIDSLKEINSLKGVSRDYVDTEIGCHYLRHPDLYFEMLEFSILKGEIFE